MNAGHGRTTTATSAATAIAVTPLRLGRSCVAFPPPLPGTDSPPAPNRLAPTGGGHPSARSTPVGDTLPAVGATAAATSVHGGPALLLPRAVGTDDGSGGSGVGGGGVSALPLPGLRRLGAREAVAAKAAAAASARPPLSSWQRQQRQRRLRRRRRRRWGGGRGSRRDGSGGGGGSANVPAPPPSGREGGGRGGPGGMHRGARPVGPAALLSPGSGGVARRGWVGALTMGPPRGCVSARGG